MSKFMIFFLTTYSLMHALFFLRIRVLLPDGRWTRWVCFFFLLMMILAPMTGRLLERAGYDFPARLTAFIGYYWMGFVFLGFVGAFCMGIFDSLVFGIRLITRVHLPFLSGKTPALILLGIVMTLFVYGIFEARTLKIEHLKIMTHKLPTKTDSLRIVQISDIHLGLIGRKAKLTRITDKVKSLSPDILVCTGDLVDSPLDHLYGLAELFQEIRPKYGKYAVTGNHEYYAGLEHAINFMEKSGFTVLRGEVKTLNPLINIVGVDEHTVQGSAKEIALLSSLKNGLFTLFLRHQPLVSKKTMGLFDLQVSGHTHGGQIFPFHFVVSGVYPYLKGYYELENGSAIYTNRGTGTWGPQIRILAPPEITVIELTRKANP